MGREKFTMDESLKKEVRFNQKKHRRYLRMYRLGEFLKDLSSNVSSSDYGPQSKKAIAFVVLTMLVSFLLTFKVLRALLVCIGFFIVYSLVGSILFKVFTRKLSGLEEDCKRSLNQYSAEQYEKYGISDGRTFSNISVTSPDYRFDISELPCHGEVRFEDGVKISNNFLLADMRKDYGDVIFYLLGKKEERLVFEQCKNGNKTCVNNKVSSVEFNRKFGVFYGDNSSELQCMKYLSPAMQLDMIKAEKISNFSNIRIKSHCLCMNTGKSVDLPSELNIFEKKPLVKYYQEVEKFSKDMRQMGDEVYEDFQSIDFMRGSNI